MALRIDPMLREKYAQFYEFAAQQQCPSETTALFCGVDDDAALAQAQADTHAEAVTHIVVKDSPALTTLGFLGLYPAVRWIGVWKCAGLTKLPRMEFAALEGIAVVGCKRLTNFDGIVACAETLCHLYVQCGVWNAVALDSLQPFGALHGLRTLDLACSKVKNTEKLDYHTLYPEMESLTVTPGLYRYFLTEEKRK